MAKLLKIFSSAKNKVFIFTCLLVHLASCWFYFATGSPVVAIVNVISSLIYIVLLITPYKNNEGSIVIAFFEIMCFCVISELLLQGTMGYMYFTLGMVAVICYLASINKIKIFTLQIIGIITTITIFVIDKKDIYIKIGPQVNYDDMRDYIILANIMVALVNMLYVSFLYFEEQERNREVLEYNTNHDQLTGLYNRRYFYSHVNGEKETDRKYAIAMIDIDNFKKINDSYGHKLGDAALISLSDILKKSGAPEDISVRWGGEEFIVYMPETDEKSADEKLSKVMDDVRKNCVKLDNMETAFTVTVGVGFDDDISRYEKVINEADRKLYQGKNSGKNRVVM